MHASLNVKV